MIPSFTWSYVASWLTVTIIALFTVSKLPRHRLASPLLWTIQVIGSATLCRGEAPVGLHPDHGHVTGGGGGGGASGPAQWRGSEERWRGDRVGTGMQGDEERGRPWEERWRGSGTVLDGGATGIEDRADAGRRGGGDRQRGGRGDRVRHWTAGREGRVGGSGSAQWRRGRGRKVEEGMARREIESLIWHFLIFFFPSLTWVPGESTVLSGWDWCLVFELN